MEDFDLEINSSLFDTDFDEVGWVPEQPDDSDNESAKIFGYD